MRFRCRYDDHRSYLKWKSNWDLAKMVLPLIFPIDLPLFDALEKVSSDLLEVLSRLFNFILEEVPEAEEIFEKFYLNLPSMELKEFYDADGLVVGYYEEFELEKDFHNTFFNWKKFECPEINEILTNCFYLMGHGFYRNDLLEEASKMLKRCLVVGITTLNKEIQASAWYMLACSCISKSTKVILLIFLNFFIFSRYPQ